MLGLGSTGVTVPVVGPIQDHLLLACSRTVYMEMLKDVGMGFGVVFVDSLREVDTSDE